jgi:hypothetical protein
LGIPDLHLGHPFFGKGSDLCIEAGLNVCHGQRKKSAEKLSRQQDGMSSFGSILRDYYVQFMVKGPAYPAINLSMWAGDIYGQDKSTGPILSQ